MLLWVIQTSILSLVFILIVHHLFRYFVSVFTFPKTKDLLHEPIKQYKQMYEIIGKQNRQTNISLSKNKKISFSSIIKDQTANNNTNIQDNMKTELVTYLHELGGSGF
jgi:uncharacterized membrane protein YhiD involved in acid resistance